MNILAITAYKLFMRLVNLLSIKICLNILHIFCSFIVQTFQKNSQNIILLIDFYMWTQDYYLLILRKDLKLCAVENLWLNKQKLTWAR